MRLEDRLGENERSAAAFAAGEATSVQLYCTCSSPFCDAVVVTADEFRAAEQVGHRIVSLAHATTDGGEVMTRTTRYAAVR